ncbi:BON domain-containing protein [Sinorhizobium meliloti]|uniref:BON domain-containing protein n=1 Tax=Rhizobium meliloti TaxID=382 RepID=UPI00398D4118
MDNDVRLRQDILDELNYEPSIDAETADDEIATRVLKILAWGAQISAPEDIHVKVEKGFVTLEGTVDWHFQRSAAENSVRVLTGVTGIDNQLRIRPRMNVVDVRHGIREALKRNAETEAENIDVEVSGSHVILRGKVQSLRERVMAERAAWSAPGVTAVEDHLRIENARVRLGP